MMKWLIGLAVVSSMLVVVYQMTMPTVEIAPPDIARACTMDAMECPDGSFVGRTGPNCEFICPPVEAATTSTAAQIPADIQAHIDEKANRIKITQPAPMTEISSPLPLSGDAVGYWFFEASAPVMLVNWDGLIIAEGYITAEGDWMTTEFVPFAGSLEFESPYKAGDPDFMKRGAIIFKRDNPSDLPENDDAIEIPIEFSL